MSDIASTTIDRVEALHAVVDEVAAPIEAANADRLQCRAGCADCCVDGLTVFEIEAAVIRRHYATLLETAEAHPDGGCAFLDEQRSCRIYEHRPYVCRTQGLPLRWLEEDELEPDEIVESRDICPLNAEGPPLEELPAAACWSIGPFEQRLADRSSGERVALRSLFTTASKRRLPIAK